MPSLEKSIAAISPIEDQALKALIKPDADFDNAVANASKRDIEDIAVSPMQGQYIALQARLIGAKTVLEIGALGGYSTMWLAKTGAHVTSIEIDPHCRDVASENLKNAGLDGNSEIILGAALDVMPKLVAEGRKFDMVFIDADWGEQWEYFELAISLTRKNGCIYVDNVVQNLVYQIRDSLPEETILTKVGKDNRVTATLIPTITSYKEGNRKAFIDGFIIATVN